MARVPNFRIQMCRATITTKTLSKPVVHGKRNSDEDIGFRETSESSHFNYNRRKNLKKIFFFFTSTTKPYTFWTLRSPNGDRKTKNC